MSDVLHLFQFDRPLMFDLFSKMKLFYHESHASKSFIDHLFDECQSQEETDARVKKGRMEDFSFLQEEFGTVELQIFEWDECFYFRVLESSFLFLNQFEKQKWSISPIFYDTRCESEEEELSTLCTHINELIQKEHYLLYPIITEEDWKTWYYHAWSQKRRSLRM